MTELKRVDPEIHKLNPAVLAQLTGRTVINDGHAGLRVVKMLEASDKSLKGGGRLVRI